MKSNKLSQTLGEINKSAKNYSEYSAEVLKSDFKYFIPKSYIEALIKEVRQLIDNDKVKNEELLQSLLNSLMAYDENNNEIFLDAYNNKLLLSSIYTSEIIVNIINFITNLINNNSDITLQNLVNRLEITISDKSYYIFNNYQTVINNIGNIDATNTIIVTHDDINIFIHDMLNIVNNITNIKFKEKFIDTICSTEIIKGEIGNNDINKLLITESTKIPNIVIDILNSVYNFSDDLTDTNNSVVKYYINEYKPISVIVDKDSNGNNRFIEINNFKSFDNLSHLMKFNFIMQMLINLSKYYTDEHMEHNDDIRYLQNLKKMYKDIVDKSSEVWKNDDYNYGSYYYNVNGNTNNDDGNIDYGSINYDAITNNSVTNLPLITSLTNVINTQIESLSKVIEVQNAWFTSNNISDDKLHTLISSYNSTHDQEQITGNNLDEIIKIKKSDLFESKAIKIIEKKQSNLYKLFNYVITTSFLFNNDGTGSGQHSNGH